MKGLRGIFLFIVLLGCVEPYEFIVKDTTPALVVEGYISDKSFNETLAYPSDGRHFTVRLSFTSDVINVRGEPVTHASILLYDSNGGQHEYVQHSEPGVYVLEDPDFKGVPGLTYKLQIVLSEDLYESDWVSLPDSESLPMGDINYKETQIQAYRYEAGERVVRTIKGIESRIELAPHHMAGPVYYKWNFTPTWKYSAPLAPSTSPVKTCWAGNVNYLADYVLQEDNKGGYSSDLFFVETVRNERIYDDLSVLVTEQVLPEPYFYFLKELQQQNQGGFLMDNPPFNLATNLHALSDDKRVVGYFGIAREQATRWYFNRNDLSYYVDDTLLADCLVVYGPDPPADECFQCTDYSRGAATTVEPPWWRQ